MQAATNPIVRDRLHQAIVWSILTVLFWLIHSHYLPGETARALVVAAGVTALVKVALLVFFRGRSLPIAARLTTLGGLLASMYGHDDRG